ncbi:hypothetical protein ACNOYE_01275 [Nannocystaceae bacterium ST9]
MPLEPESEPKDFAASLARRMAGPQRHRLLQGYPAVPLMRRAVDDPLARRRLDGALDHPEQPEQAFVDIDPSRTLIVGVIPHTLCTPKLRGCGFCTFGQDGYRRPLMKSAIGRLHAELDHALAHPGLAGREVAALYFGGGTANLTPVDQLEASFDRLATCFDLRGAELTLEGVPSLFRSRFSAPLRWLAKLPVRRARISMGVQTFDRAQLRRMGREQFGDAALVARVVRDARERGIGSSGDLLFDLPHQTRAQMLADVEQAIAIGFEQICLYHLVLYPELGTAWSRDAELLAALPSNAESLANWLALREALIAAGYVQTSLTNFERADVHASERRFVYEELSFSPSEVDGLGIGPLSLSTFVDWPRRRAIKLLRARKSVDPAYGTHDYWFPYQAEDLELLVLTRTLARLRWRGAEHRARFGVALERSQGGAIDIIDIIDIIDTIVAAGLAIREGEDLVLTPSGMFYADSIAGLLAERRAGELREAGEGVHTNSLLRDHHHMG